MIATPAETAKVTRREAKLFSQLLSQWIRLYTFREFRNFKRMCLNVTKLGSIFKAIGCCGLQIIKNYYLVYYN